MTAPLLSMRELRKAYGRVTAVDGVSLDVAGNEFFALLGASGSGKTTLLRMLAGFEAPSSGAILLAGRDITALPPNRRPVNLMFQSYALFPHMTVRANIAYGLEMERLPRREIAARVGAMLEVVQLTAQADRRPDQLSGGQRQRVALARALVKRPQVLLLDEPLGALDARLRAAMQLELKRLQAEVGITFVIVTHDQDEALVMADRIAILRDGRLVQCAPPREIYEHPADLYAATFIGLMNVLPGRAGGPGLIAADGTAIAALAALPAGTAAVAAVRPERLRIGAGENRLSGHVRALAYHGGGLQVQIASPLAPAPVILALSARAAEAAALAPGDTVTLGWDARDTRLFPA
ncbi:MAG: ABC transporter ATP-binding protein [Gemmobacter sp.]